ncbi:xylan alpha-(1-_2)-glucuronosidase [Paenibacillus silvae]|uniref:Xylan alpha-1,2-glucuronidase n=1 Tax=Paenibacillus silvae TaxID=1325358 RepID=A0ABQ1Z4Z0_9BACL|nr:alpha-glucuronidase family glycosyl hydrolase [Paenibacillus silvae]GGH49885.1 xylan alpha-(1->2)-glucuronosidase [Paenibacillus silvae]
MSQTTIQSGLSGPQYDAWLGYHAALPGANDTARKAAPLWSKRVEVQEQHEVMDTALTELSQGLGKLYGVQPEMIKSQTQGSQQNERGPAIRLGTWAGSDFAANVLTDAERAAVHGEGFIIREDESQRELVIGSETPQGILYAVFHLLRELTLKQEGAEAGAAAVAVATESQPERIVINEQPVNSLRMINQWDNVDGSIERGYAGRSIFYENGEFTQDIGRIRDYARLLASTGINAVAINNVNVHRKESLFLTERYLGDVAKVAAAFRAYGIRLFLSANYASPIEVGGLQTADPLDEQVREWWSIQTAKVYAAIPDFGGYLIKADSENRPGPFTYNRDHADGANMLAEALRPFGGLVIWRCFVYNCKQDWRDRSTDRARAAYDHFKPLDGRFADNVILQIKNGPMDFQVREAVSPLFGAMEDTNQIIEFQITQEYTGQQRHLAFLVPQWKEVLDFDTYAKGKGSEIKRIADGSLYQRPYSGFAAVSNIGADACWTGHPLAQANLYGYGRLGWNPDLSAEQIADEWVRLTFGHDEQVVERITGMLLSSLDIYENYTAPLGVGWMVNPDHHYGPNVDGYEYSKWGTYHFADRYGIGVDRTVKSGTGYTSQYHPENAARYESLETCPDELILFFHHVPYTHVLHSGKTVIQHIYDTHFEGVEQAEALAETWRELEGKVDPVIYSKVAELQAEQAEHAKEWRDMINTYFYRKSGIQDEHARKIY